ncbi:MAG: WYL domain-containing protein [Lachnospiraceae bacterium]|nr:WYL domain-containing protein [Lachnospiraceae bacterium]
MAKGSNQKLKLVYLIRILFEKTDESHKMTMQDILESLAAYDVTAERKSIYADMEALRELGIDVIGEQQGKTFYYYVASRQFELAELKFLVDAIQSSKFITAKKSKELIKKLESLTSRHEAVQLQRQVYVSGRVKNMNESIYYNVDAIHNAIASNRQIRFRYFAWNVNKEMELRKGGAFYEVSPWALTWSDENYYMIAFDEAAGQMKHYRVDKMLQIDSVDRAREGRALFEKTDMAQYEGKRFGMFGGEEQYVKLLCENSMANVIIDRFGKDIMMVPADANHFRINVNVAVSEPFFGWVFAMAGKVRIEGPDTVAERMREMAAYFI